METRALDTSQPPLFGRLSSEAQRLGSPFRGDVCLFFCPRTVNMLFFRLFCDFKEIWEAKLAESAFKMRFEDTFQKRYT